MKTQQKKTVFLVGMPGSGKSKYGQKIARHFNFEFIDSDTEIEKKENKSITDIFAEKGEAYFRQLESDFLRSLPSDQIYLVSTGGGLPCHNDNMSYINQVGLSIYLEVPLHILASRIMDSTSRPAFMDMDVQAVREKLDELLKTREPFYLQSQYVINFDEGPVLRQGIDIIDHIRQKNDT